MGEEKDKMVCPSCNSRITDPEALCCTSCGAKLGDTVAGGIDTNFILIFACAIINVISCFLKWDNQHLGLDYPVCAFVLLPNIVLLVFMCFELFNKIRCCNLLLISVPLISIISVFVGGLLGLDVPYRGGWHNNVISFDYVSVGFYMLIMASVIGFISSLLLVRMTINQGRHFILIEKIEQ